MARTEPVPEAKVFEEYDDYDEVGNLGLDENGATRFTADKYFIFDATTEEWVEQATMPFYV